MELNQFEDLMFSVANVDALLYMIQTIGSLEGYDLDSSVVIVEEIIKII